MVWYVGGVERGLCEVRWRLGQYPRRRNGDSCQMCTGVYLRRVCFCDSSSPCYNTLVSQFRILNQCLRGVYVSFLPTVMCIFEGEKSQPNTRCPKLTIRNQRRRQNSMLQKQSSRPSGWVLLGWFRKVPQTSAIWREPPNRRSNSECGA